jgi:hypothetical protein
MGQVLISEDVHACSFSAEVLEPGEVRSVGRAYQGAVRLFDRDGLKRRAQVLEVDCRTHGSNMAGGP